MNFSRSALGGSIMNHLTCSFSYSSPFGHSENIDFFTRTLDRHKNVAGLNIMGSPTLMYVAVIYSEDKCNYLQYYIYIVFDQSLQINVYKI
jgi:hypothetical protein